MAQAGHLVEDDAAKRGLLVSEKAQALLDPVEAVEHVSQGRFCHPSASTTFASFCMAFSIFPSLVRISVNCSSRASKTESPSMNQRIGLPSTSESRGRYLYWRFSPASQAWTVRSVRVPCLPLGKNSESSRCVIPLRVRACPILPPISTSFSRSSGEIPERGEVSPFRAGAFLGLGMVP